MSLAEDGRSIHCDGDSCNATAPFPVALRPVLGANPARSTATARGWLCVLSQGSGRYYCPVCAIQYLKSLGSDINMPVEPNLVETDTEQTKKETESPPCR